MAKHRLHRLHIAGNRQHLGGQGPSAAVRQSLLDTGLPVEPANGLLERITGPVYLWPTIQLAVLERQFKGFSYLYPNADQLQKSACNNQP